MEWLHLLSYFFAGMFLTNAVPHFRRRRDGRTVFRARSPNRPAKDCRHPP